VKRAIDVRIENHGSVLLFTPCTPPAQEWVNENVQLEGWQWLGNGFAVDPRYADQLIAGMEEAGLVVS
jgi:hypothetical protein